MKTYGLISWSSQKNLTKVTSELFLISFLLSHLEISWSYLTHTIIIDIKITVLMLVLLDYYYLIIDTKLVFDVYYDKFLR